MNKTKLNKKRKLKKTKKMRKYYGGRDLNKEEVFFDKKEGIIDLFKNKLSDMALASGKYLEDKSLRLFGLQPIKSGQETAQNQQIDSSIENIGSATNNILSDVKSVGDNFANVANKSSAALLENINEVLGSKQVNETIFEAANNTKQILEKELEIFNKPFSDPQFKELAKKSLDNVSEYADIAVDALNKPIDKVIDKLNESGEKAVSGVVSGSIKVGTDALAAVPGWGAIIELGKMANDTSKAVSSVVEAGSEAASTLSDAYIETSHNIKEGLEELEKRKKDAMDIANRTNESINQFENPIANTLKKIPDVSQEIPSQYDKSYHRGPIISNGGKSKKNHKGNVLKRKSKRVKFIY
jgi:hypothetical protein